MGESCSWSLEIRMSCSYGLALMRAKCPHSGVSPGITQQILGICGDLPGLELNQHWELDILKNHRDKVILLEPVKILCKKRQSQNDKNRNRRISAWKIHSIHSIHSWRSDHDHPGEVMEKEPPESFPENRRWDDGGKKWCPKERTIATRRKQFSNFKNVFVFGINTIFWGRVILTISRFVCGTNFKRYPNNWVF